MHYTYFCMQLQIGSIPSSLTIVLTTVKPCQRIHHLGSRAPLLGGGAGGQPDPQFMEILTKQPPHGTDALADTLAQVVEAPAAQIPFG